jgi:hypothetical protein
MAPQERLADAQNAQTTADASAKAADIKQKHLAKKVGARWHTAARTAPGCHIAPHMPCLRSGWHAAVPP